LDRGPVPRLEPGARSIEVAVPRLVHHHELAIQDDVPGLYTLDAGHHFGECPLNKSAPTQADLSEGPILPE